ncbi:MAG: HRDC domain-containing protein, partial [Clostridia bacterium]|nr:HRDC domain-containing protein [Clostridia bacterium]
MSRKVQTSCYFEEKNVPFGNSSQILNQPAGIIFFSNETLYIDLFNEKDKQELCRFQKVNIANMASMRLHNCLISASLNTLESVINLPVSEIMLIRNFGRTSLYELYLLGRMIANNFDGENITFDLEYFLALPGNYVNINHCRNLRKAYSKQLEALKTQNRVFPDRSLWWYLSHLEEADSLIVNLTDELADYGKTVKEFHMGSGSHKQIFTEICGLLKGVFVNLPIDDRVKFILCTRFGLDGDEKTLEDVSNELNVTRERVRQLEKKILKKLPQYNKRAVFDYNLLQIKKSLRQVGVGGFLLYLYKESRINLLRLLILTVYRDDDKAVIKTVRNYYINSDLQKKTALEKKTEPVQSTDSNLYEQLRLCRLRKAREENVAAFYIMTNKTLSEVVNAKPTTYEEWLKVKGLGEITYKKLGEEFIEIIKNYTADSGQEVIKSQVESKTVTLPTEKIKGYEFICDENGEILTDGELFEELRQLRLKFATEADIPAYCIISNA